jgi:hypothetical protein
MRFSGQPFRTPETARVERVRQKYSSAMWSFEFPAVMTDLYRDPANACVALVDMVYIARDRLEGKDVEKSLGDARRRALELWRFR